MENQNSLLRSAYQIAKREGSKTNWEAFTKKIEAELVKQAGGNAEDEQHVLRATCTPLTFRMP